MGVQRTRVAGLENVETERTVVMGGEVIRECVYRDGVYVGDVVYVGRRRKARGLEVESSSTGSVTDYGWRPDGWRYATNVRLTDKRGAIERLRSVV